MTNPTEKWPPLDPGTRVMTTCKKLSDREWTPDALIARKWGVTGTIIKHHDAHGLFYDVQHDDGTEGYYDPTEFAIIPGPCVQAGRMDKCSYCGGRLGVDRIESAGGGFRHYSKIDCCDVLMIQRNAYRVQLEHLAKLADLVMKDLETHGPSIVPHLIDTDDNDGQRLREAVEKALLESSPTRLT